MRFSLSILILSCLLAVALASSQNSLSRESYWNLKEKAQPWERVSFHVALNQRSEGLDQLSKIVLDRSDPLSPRYGKYLTKEEILDMVAPSAEVSQSVADYFGDHCPSSKIENFRDVLKITSSVECIERIFAVEMHAYIHIENGYRLIRRHTKGAPATIPRDLKPNVSFVTGLSEFPVVRKTQTQKVSEEEKRAIFEKMNNGTSPSKDPESFVFNFVIPETARALYGIPSGSKVTNKRNTQSVVEFVPYGAPFISDMQSFAKQAGEIFTNFSHIGIGCRLTYLTVVVGPWTPTGEVESTLDIEYESSLAPGADQYYVTVNGWIYEMAVALFTMPKTPLVNSVSYGWPEALSCQSSITNANCDGYTSQTYNARADAELKKLAGAGISVIVCSQDEGAPSEQNIGCQLDNTFPLWPIYPSTSPWVTTVSATTLIDTTSVQPQNDPPICNMGYTCAKGDLEYPCMPNNTYFSWTTGGGFSNYTARPTWQNDAVQSWLSSGAIIPPDKFFERGNRGYPDVSALGSRILIWNNGNLMGTSASTPMFAAMVTLLNDYRLNNGKAPLGFVAPLLYRMHAARPTCFKDINVGNNKGTSGTVCKVTSQNVLPEIFKYGYGAADGWDPVTGLGTPNYMQMLAYIKNLP